jgi:diaminopimelate epimerase
MSDYSYQILIPGGNDTALVLGRVDDPAERKEINDVLMAQSPNVEQVGFVSSENGQYTLTMAGGEFCGNATRAAAWLFLQGAPGEMRIAVSGVAEPLQAGVTAAGDAWAQMPVHRDLREIEALEDGIFLVRLEGIAHLVLSAEKAAAYLQAKEDLKEQAKRLLHRHHLLAEPAAGVLFLEALPTGLQLHPCVYVSGIHTMFYETACGSGTMAVGLLQARLSGQDVTLPLRQPSGETITAQVWQQNAAVTRAVISGSIQADPIVHTLHREVRP